MQDAFYEDCRCRPYSVPTEEGRGKNLEALNAAGKGLLQAGHIPVIGVNAALPVVAGMPEDADRYAAILNISVTAIGACEEMLLIGGKSGRKQRAGLVHCQGLTSI